MPVHACTLDGKPGYQWGGSGACYTYTAGDEAGRKEAKHKAIIQGYAAQQHGAKEAQTMTDVHVPTTQQGPPAKPKPYGVLKSAGDALTALPDEILVRPAVVSARTLTSQIALRLRGLPGLRMLFPLKKSVLDAGASPWVRFTHKTLPDEFGLYDLKLVKRPLNGHTPPAKASEDDFAILKADEAKQLVTGVVFEPDVVDTQGDYVPAADIEQAAHDFLAAYRAGSTKLRLLHDRDLSDEDAVLVENWVTPQAMTIGGNRVKQGSWVQTWHLLNASLWKAVTDGTLTGFSFGGSGERKEEFVEKAEPVARATPVEVKVSLERPREAFTFDITRDAEGRATGLKGVASKMIDVEKDGDTVSVIEAST